MESVLMMLVFAIENHNINTFRVKIGDSNEASLNMFKKLVHFFLLISLILLVIRLSILHIYAAN